MTSHTIPHLERPKEPPRPNHVSAVNAGRYQRRVRDQVGLHPCGDHLPSDGEQERTRRGAMGGEGGAGVWSLEAGEGGGRGGRELGGNRRGRSRGGILCLGVCRWGEGGGE